jgi:hypothetical protein
MNTLKLIRDTLKEMIAQIELGMRRAGPLAKKDMLSGHRLLSEAIGAASAVATVATLLATRIPSARARSIGEGAVAEVDRMNRAARAMRDDLERLMTETGQAPEEPVTETESPPISSDPETPGPDLSPSEQESDGPMFHPADVNGVTPTESPDGTQE